ncbi:hypothetical protein JXJ21_19860 [candidate division KSB1 bacterium]|nr:hypothetical protein [candidate division KSB1 bacterium]
MNESPQSVIENEMRRIVTMGNYEMAHLFSDEGLPIAEAKNEESLERDRLIEISVYLQDIKRIADMMGGMSRLKEITMEGDNSRRIIFRFFEAFDQTVIFVAIVPPRTSYRKLTNQLVKLIQTVSA